MKYEDSIYVSFIIPVHNCGSEIERTIHKLLQNKVVWTKSEVILIENGSSDDTYDKCVALQEKYFMIKVLQSNKANVSSARNLGVKNAKGKYLFYLDADDELAEGTIDNIIAYFDKVYDEVDLVTYPIETVFKGEVLAPHFRYKYLVEDGVYDLKEHPFIGQTTMNIVVKNKFDNNILFDESQSFSEDQRYCCDVLKEKLKMGFCNKGKYIYYRSPDSSSGRLSGACYVFEQCMNFFESLFEGYDEVPLAFQGLYVNDIYWKMLSNILFPYHYEEQKFNKAVERIKKLLSRCSNSVILDHPQIDFFEKFYMLRLKHSETLKCVTESNSFSLWDSQKLIIKENSMEVVVTSLKVKNDTVYIDGFLKSVFLQFYNDEVILCALENNGKVTRKLSLSESAHCYYLSHEKTQKFLAFQYKADINEIENVSFSVLLGGHWFPTHFYFMPLVSLSHSQKRYSSIKGNVKISLCDKRSFSFRRIEKNRKQIWLYYDCVGVSKDNGMLQFEHDIKLDDGVERYYIVTDKKQELHGIQKKYMIKFGSTKHKLLMKKCTKIITAYIEEENILPYSRKDYDKHSQFFDFEVIYLQHGVLHAIVPWKYARERIIADKIVVSTNEEAELLKKNGFSDKSLIKTGMPRFEFIKKEEQERVILFAPSWRMYLVGGYSKHNWAINEKKFNSSVYYKKTIEFLRSKELEIFLKENNLKMEVKLHPIFEQYRQYFDVESNYIELISDNRRESKYCMFVTDFSSYAYNFEYLNIPVVHFIPDYDEFRCGMNGYRDLNYNDDFWGNVSSSSESLVDKMKNVLDGNYDKKNINFYSMSNITEEIYNKMIE